MFVKITTVFIPPQPQHGQATYLYSIIPQPCTCSLKSGLDNFELTSLTVTLPCSPIYLFHVDRVAERLGDGVGERVAGKEDTFCRKIKKGLEM